MKIAYVTDSGCGRNIATLAEMGIISVPLQIMDGEITYQDLETLNQNQCLNLVESGHVLKTSQPSLGIIEDCFTNLKEAGVDLIIAVPICNGLSGTISTMTSVARSMDMKIICIDTYVTSEVQFYLICRIKQLYEEGKSDMEIKLLVDEVIDSCNTLILPRNLDTLVKGGRLTPIAAGFAKLLKIVPVLNINKSTSGRIDSVANVRTYRKAVAKTIEILQNAGLDKAYALYIAHAKATQAAMDLYHQYKELFPEVDMQVIELVNPVAAHTGSDCIALQYFKKL